jgi:hypothetical protein
MGAWKPTIRILARFQGAAFSKLRWLTLKRLVNLLGVESHDDRIINDDHRSGHIPEFLEIGQGAQGLALCPSLETVGPFAKDTPSPGHRTVTVLGINDDVLHLLSPPG